MSEIQLKDPIVMRPAHFQDALRQLMKTIDNNDLTFAEVGSYRGESADVFLSTGKIKKMYCIDPWQNFYDANDAASNTDMNKVMKDFDNRVLAKYDYVEKHRGTLETFIKTSHDKIDVIYIDANHTYEAAKNDILNAITHIDPTICIAGHDYAKCYGVYQAVNEIFGKPDMTFADSSWIVFRKSVKPFYGI